MITLLLIAASFTSSSYGTSYRSGGCNVPLPASITPDSVDDYSIYNQGQHRKFKVYVPGGYDGTQALPVVFALPGFYTDADTFTNEFALNKNAKENGYIAVTAQGNIMKRLNGGEIINWNDKTSSASPGPSGPICDAKNLNRPVPVPGACDLDPDGCKMPEGCADPDAAGCRWSNCQIDELAWIKIMVKSVEDDYCVERSRIYLLGWSNGAMMAHTVACEMNDRFAAISPWHGQRHIGFSCKPAAGTTKVPLMNIWGENDLAVPGMAVKSRNAWYYLPVMAVQDAFSDFNGCDKTNGQQAYTPVAYTNTDPKFGIDCTGFITGCQTTPTIQCHHRGKHEYPVDIDDTVTPNTRTNFVMPTVWNFFKDKTKAPPTRRRLMADDAEENIASMYYISIWTIFFCIVAFNV